MRKISLKYAGRCGKCGQWIPAGETAFWEEGKGVWHLHCGASIVQETPDVRKPPQDRKHRFHLRPQLVGTILITIIAFSAGLALGPYVTPYRSMPSQELNTITVTTTVGTSICVCGSLGAHTHSRSHDSLSYATHYLFQSETHFRAFPHVSSLA